MACVSKPLSQNKANSPLGGNNDTISFQYQGPDITRWGWPKCVCGATPLGKPLWPMGQAWKSLGLASGASKTCEEGRGCRRRLSCLVLVSVTRTSALPEPPGQHVFRTF